MRKSGLEVYKLSWRLSHSGLGIAERRLVKGAVDGALWRPVHCNPSGHRLTAGQSGPARDVIEAPVRP